MIKQVKNKRSSWIRYAATLPAVGALFFVYSCARTVVSPSAKSTSPTGNEKFAEQRPDVFTAVEEMPEFAGGIEKLFKFLGENIKYPEDAIKEKTQGTVYTTFIVNEDGSLDDISVMKGLSKSCDKEALRVILATSGKWISGKQSGKNVKVRYMLPIRFIL